MVKVEPGRPAAPITFIEAATIFNGLYEQLALKLLYSAPNDIAGLPYYACDFYRFVTYYLYYYLL